MQHARQRGVNDLWLHVRADNPGAVQMYADLEFVERARRTTWRMRKETQLSSPSISRSDHTPGLPTVTKRYSRFWPAFLGGLVVTVVSVVLSLILKDELKRHR